MKNIFQENTVPTIGVEFGSKIVQVKEGAMKIQLFDTAGQEKYRSIMMNYIRKALGCLLVYDISKLGSFELVKSFLTDLKTRAEPDCVFILVGNKTDLEHKREVSQEEAKRFAADNGLYFIETSACKHYKVNEAFDQLCNCIYTINIIVILIVIFQESKKNVNYQSNADYVQIQRRKNPIITETKSSCC